jgi:hypothetical protein
MRIGHRTQFEFAILSHRDRGRRDRRDATQVKSTPPHASFSSVTRFAQALLSSPCPQKQPVVLSKNSSFSAAKSCSLFGVERDNDCESWAATPHDSVSDPLGVTTRPPAACAPDPKISRVSTDVHDSQRLIVNHPKTISLDSCTLSVTHLRESHAKRTTRPETPRRHRRAALYELEGAPLFLFGSSL